MGRSRESDDQVVAGPGKRQLGGCMRLGAGCVWNTVVLREDLRKILRICPLFLYQEGLIMLKDILMALCIALTAVVIIPIVAAVAAVHHLSEQMKSW